MCLLVNSGRACSRHCASRVRESNWRGIILWLVAFLGDGAFIWGLPVRNKKQRGAQSSSFTDGRLFRCEQPNRMETFPSPLIQLQTWLTLPELLVSMLSCYSVRSYELTDFLSSKPACQLLAEFPLKGKGLPSLEAEFLHLQKQRTSQTHSQAVLHHEKCEKYLFYSKV